MTNTKEFVIENGNLKKYKGRGGEVVIPEGITSIGSKVFRGRTDVIAVVIPKGVTVIGQDAFCGCTKLSKVTLPEGLTVIDAAAFNACEALTAVAVPDSVTEIGACAFQGCKSLTRISVPAGVTEIGERAFYLCPMLADGNGFVIVCNRLFGYHGPGGHVVIPDGVTEISTAVFMGCKTVDKVFIPGSVTVIGEYAFDRCIALQEVTCSEGLIQIGRSAFQRCTSLCQLSLPKGVSRIGNSAFGNCDALTTVSIPESISKINETVFDRCYSLSRIFISNPMVLHPDHRLAAVIGFTAKPFPDTDPRCKVYYRLIKKNAGRWMQQAVANPELLNIMCREKLISAKLAPDYQQAAQTNGSGECIAMLLEYNFRKLTPGEKRRAERKKNADEDTVFTRKLMRAGKVGIDGLVFVAAGRLNTFQNRSELKTLIERQGGELLGTVSAKVDYLIIASDAPEHEKRQQAAALGVDVITEMQFNAMAGRYFVIRKDYLMDYLGPGGDVVIPEGVKTIGREAFWHCTTLTSVVIPEGVTQLESRTFQGCIALTRVSLPEGLIRIGNHCFENCVALTDISIPSSVKAIGHDAFADCARLTSIAFPEGITTIGDYAFLGCTDLASITIPDSITSIGFHTFHLCPKLPDAEGFLILAHQLVEYSGSGGDVVIPEGVTEIANWCFYNRADLTSVSIPEGVTAIGSNSFKDCIALSGVSLPESLQWIGKSAFYGCTALQTLTIPEGVCGIGFVAFRSCGSLILRVRAGSFGEAYAKENYVPYETQ